MRPDSLQQLSRDRLLITPELHMTNDFYGNATILKHYAGIPRRRPLKAAVEHGINLTQQVWDVDLESRLPLFLCASTRRASLFESLAPGSKRAVAIGPLIRYLPPGDEPDQDPVRRLLLIPAHSTHHVEANYDIGAFVRLGLEPYAGWDEVEVCLYWKDVLRGVAREYRSRGLRCVTAGHIYDPDFLLRFRSILRRASAVVTNEAGSHIFYAVLEGKPAWHIEQPTSWSGESPGPMVGDVTIGAQLGGADAEARRLFAEPREEPSYEQREFAAQVAGLDQLRSAAELREILDEAEQRYRRLYPAGVRGARRVRRAAGNTANRLAQTLRDLRARNANPA